MQTAVRSLTHLQLCCLLCLLPSAQTTPLSLTRLAVMASAYPVILPVCLPSSHPLSENLLVLSNVTFFFLLFFFLWVQSSELRIHCRPGAVRLSKHGRSSFSLNTNINTNWIFGISVTLSCIYLFLRLWLSGTFPGFLDKDLSIKLLISSVLGIHPYSTADATI